MRNSSKLSSLALAFAALAAPLAANAAAPITVACSVAVDYTLNGVVQEPYRKAFNLQPGVGFSDDFSTPIRSKTFTATVAREAGNLVVAIDYFNDVGVFHAIGFNTRLTLHDGKGIETTAGSHTFSTSLGVTGNHTTNYTLTCRRL
jgi:hypothetical protein